MDLGQPDLHLTGMAAIYRLGKTSLHLKRKLRELVQQYPQLQEDLEDYQEHWWRQQVENFDCIGTEDDESGPTWDLERLANQAKQLRRELLDLIKRADPSFPDEEEYAAYCAAVDAQATALLGESESM